MAMMFIGNVASLKVHAEDCSFAFEIAPENYAVFPELHHALRQEYRECTYCLGGGRARELAVRVHGRSRTFRAASEFGACLICGEDRGVQRAHIIPRRQGGALVMPLCPNHHWNYDHGLLAPEEQRSLRAYLSSKARGSDHG